MRQRHAHLQHAPKNASQFAEYDCVKRAAVARFEVLSRAHTVERQHEEVENIAEYPNFGWLKGDDLNAAKNNV